MLKSLLRLLPYVRKYARQFWFGMFGLLGARIFEALIPLLVKRGVDNIALGRTNFDLTSITYDQAMDALFWPCVLIISCVVAQMLVTIFSRIMIRRIGMEAAYDMRNRVYDHLQKQGPKFFSQHSIGDLMARAINDIGLVRMVIAGASRMTLVLIFTAIVGVIFMFSLSVPLTLALMAPMPFITLVARHYGKKIYALSHVVQEGFSNLSTFVQENLNGIRTVQAMAQEEEEVERFEKVNQQYADDNLKLFTNTSLLGAWMPALAAVCTLVIIGYGSHLVNNGSISLGTLAAFFSYLALVLWPVREAGTIVTQWQRGASAAQRLFEILDYEPEIQDRPSQEYPDVSGTIRLDHVYYSYEDKEKYALEDISFDVAPGEMIAILGRVGSGKSTLLRLMVRLLEPTKGKILLDGHPIDQFPLAKLRENVCMVLQDPFLFADSLGDNIAYDNPGRRSDEIRDSAQAAALDETINRLPAGLDTILGERGVTLSGGQKQRTALARGLIRGTPILILDDCFSAVDTETEEHILSGLKAVRTAKTTLIVSHRVSTARHADRIIVLDEGRIIETGSHTELLASGGFYAELEMAQSQKGHLINRLSLKEDA
jgi:ATP-binding cassette, subfamily B, multidrug efflux pump